jgi:hypothetical protein
MSTYSSSLRIDLITNGTQAGVWGDTTNNNLAYILDTSIAGYQTVSVIAASQALTYTNGPSTTAANNQSVYAMLRFTTTTGAAFAVYAPPASKTYIIWNNSGQSMTIYNSTVIGNTTAAGTGITISNGNKVLIWSDATNFYEVQAANLTGTLAIANGGTGQTTANAALNALLPVQTSNANKYLQTDGTNTSWDAISLSTADITGTLPVANGGTGQATVLTQYGILYGSTTTAMATTLAGTSTQVLHGNASGAPTWGSVSLTADVSGTLAVANGGTGVTTSTGSGANVLSTSPSLTTPLLGTPTSGNFSTGTFTWPTFNQNTSGTAGGLSATLAVASGGTGVTTSTGTGSVVLSTSPTLTSPTLTSPTLTTPVLGTPSSGNLANCTFPTLNQNTTGSAGSLSATLAVSSGGTGNSSQSQYGVLYAATTSSLTGNPSVLSFDGTNLGIGTNSPSTYGKLTVLGTGSFTNSLVSTSATAADYPTLEFRKTRNTAGGNENNAIGRFSFYSQNGTTTTESAYIDVTDTRFASLPYPAIEIATYNQTIGANAASLTIGGTQTRLYTLSSNGIQYTTSGSAPHTFTGRVVFDATRASDMPGGISNAGVITLANLVDAAKPIGASQTWQDVTASRAINVTYTNSTGRPIMVNITGAFTVNQYVEILIGGSVIVAKAAWDGFASGRVWGTVSAIIPAGNTYQATSTGLNSLSWAELR